jgi:hypothetical protein
VKIARLLWTQYPYRAGFCITDDTDAATLIQTKAVYDFLLDRRFVTTKTVWPFTPVEPSGIPPTPDSTLRGVTLADQEYLQYCTMLRSHGFEICLHGASAGNNVRKRTADAFDLLTRHFGNAQTFICHSKNAENIYWEHKVTRLFPFTLLLRLYSKHTCSGEDEHSPYFWGDICRERVQQIRLYRTRNINTLGANPSMPYHCPNKPYVHYWFSATKRRIADCATDAALKRLLGENGLTVLYQYLHRYADPATGALNGDFTAAVETLRAEHALHVATVSEHMARLRHVRNVVAARYRDNYWIVNLSTVRLAGIQFAIGDGGKVEIDSETVKVDGNRLFVPALDSMAAAYFTCRCPLRFGKCTNVDLQRGKSRTVHVPRGTVAVRIDKITSTAMDRCLRYDLREAVDEHPRIESLPMLEEARLIVDQFRIIAREILSGGRTLDCNRYLDASREILLENHDNW